MTRFILLSFVFLGLGFYELSGGSDFDPKATRAAQIEARLERDALRIAALPETPTPATRLAEAPSAQSEDGAHPQVTRAALNLVSFETVTQPRVAAAEIHSAPTPKIETAAISEFAAEQELSLAALEDTPSTGASNVFAGTSISASSGDVRADIDIRVVKGSLVNMRSGPGTEYDVVDQLSQSTRVEVLTDTGNGWVELRPLDGGPAGWMAAFLLSDG
ncbi:MAG: SH3 domain-containing protein [Pseudomonadota bacterium]